MGHLRHREPARREYDDFRRAVYALHPADIEAYNDGKGAWIKRIEPLALEWYRLRGRSPEAYCPTGLNSNEEKSEYRPRRCKRSCLKRIERRAS